MSCLTAPLIAMPNQKPSQVPLYNPGLKPWVYRQVSNKPHESTAKLLFRFFFPIDFNKRKQFCTFVAKLQGFHFYNYDEIVSYMEIIKLYQLEPYKVSTT